VDADFFSSIPFFTIPVRWSTHPIAKMKLSSSTPASSVCFPFGRHAKLFQWPSTFVTWMGWSLSIDQIYEKERQVGNMTRPFEWPTTIYHHPSVGWTSGQTFRPFVPCHICYPTLNEITSE
jgi:hypothetical protein